MQELNFIKEIDLLKNIERQSPPLHANRRENSAEHSWHLALASYVLKDYAHHPVNLEKVLLLALIHDVVEIDSGDTFIYGNQESKMLQEENTLKRLSGMLPTKTQKEVQALWYEYETNETPEAQYVNALDRFLPIYANYVSKGYSWKKHGIKKHQVIEKNKAKIMSGLPLLWPLVEKIMDEAICEGYLLEK